MRRDKLFEMKPMGRHRRRGASPASQARRSNTKSCEIIQSMEAPLHSSETECCDPFHCPPNCSVLQAGNCPDSD